MKTSSVATLSLIAGLAVGVASGYGLAQRRAERDLEGLQFIRAVGTIATSGTTLRIAEQKRLDKIILLHEMYLRNAAKEAANSSGQLPRVPFKLQHLEKAVVRASEYAAKQKWMEVERQLAVVQMKLAMQTGSNSSNTRQ